MSPDKILALQLSAFAYGLAVIVLFQLLTGRINMQGLLVAKDGLTNVSPERVMSRSRRCLTMRYSSRPAAAAGDAIDAVGAGRDHPARRDIIPRSVYAAGKLWRRFWK